MPTRNQRLSKQRTKQAMSSRTLARAAASASTLGVVVRDLNLTKTDRDESLLGAVLHCETARHWGDPGRYFEQWYLFAVFRMCWSCPRCGCYKHVPRYSGNQSTVCEDDDGFSSSRVSYSSDTLRAESVQHDQHSWSLASQTVKCANMQLTCFERANKLRDQAGPWRVFARHAVCRVACQGIAMFAPCSCHALAMLVSCASQQRGSVCVCARVCVCACVCV